MTVIDMERKIVDRIAGELAPALGRHGFVAASVAEVDNVERWRNAARRAARQLGEPVRTAISSDGTTVWAVLDRPVRRGEQAAAANAVATLVFGPRPFVRAVKPER